MLLMERVNHKNMYHNPSAAIILGAAYLVIHLGFSIWSSTLNNYVVDHLQMGPDLIGFIRSAAYVPGLLAICIGYTSQKIHMVFLLLLAFVLLSAGLIIQGATSSYSNMGLAAVMISTGAILSYPLINSLCLQTSPGESAGIALGRLKGFGPLSAISAALLIIFLLPSLGFNTLFLLTGGFILVAGLCIALVVGNRFHKARAFGRQKLDQRLWGYYMLNFLNGCRSGLFKSFVIYLMVHDYNLKIDATAGIVLAGYLLSFLSYRVAGAFISRFGVFNVLRVMYLVVAIIFGGYCIAASKSMLTILFLIDSLLVSTSVATDSYLKTQVHEDELVGHISSGISFFYLASILAPMAGGLLWKNAGPEIVFITGSAVAILAFLTSGAIDASNMEKVPPIVGRVI